MQMDEVTQQNAALVEQAAAASQSMADQARALGEKMGQYRTRRRRRTRTCQHGHRAAARLEPRQQATSVALASDGRRADDMVAEKPKCRTRPAETKASGGGAPAGRRGMPIRR